MTNEPIDSDAAKAERNAAINNRRQTHVVRKIVAVHTEDGQAFDMAYYLKPAVGPAGSRFPTDRLADAEEFHGSKDAIRAATFAGVEWQAIPKKSAELA